MKNPCSSYSIIICSIIRDAEIGLKRNIPVITTFAENFKDWTIIVFENDSKDNTKEILKDWAKRYPHNVIIRSEDMFVQKPINANKNQRVNPFFSRARISKMVNLRNQYLDFINDYKMTADFLMVVDLDVACIKYDGLVDTFRRSEKWDAVTAYGYSYSPRLKKRYHDTYALTLLENENKVQTENDIYNIAEKMAKDLDSTKDLFRVNSAFGGLAIYRYEAIKGLRYLVLPNNDDKVEVHCEHFSIYQQMKSKGYDRVFINPELSLKYQELSLNLVYTYLRRKIFNKVKKIFMSR